MCEYCKENKFIRDSVGDKIKLNENVIISERKVGNIFNNITIYTTLRINYCPMCGRKL